MRPCPPPLTPRIKSRFVPQLPGPPPPSLAWSPEPPSCSSPTHQTSGFFHFLNLAEPFFTLGFGTCCSLSLECPSLYAVWLVSCPPSDIAFRTSPRCNPPWWFPNPKPIFLSVLCSTHYILTALCSLDVFFPHYTLNVMRSKSCLFGPPLFAQCLAQLLACSGRSIP